MKFSAASTLATVALLAGKALGHARVYQYHVDGVAQGAGAGKYVRQPPSNSPIKVLSSADVMCNVNGATAVSDSVSVAAGGTLTPEWMHDNQGDDIIAASHLGPIVAYLAPASSNGVGNVWTKISEDGYSATNGWAVARLIANKGKHDIKIPASLAAGDYILRVEILALHEADALYTANSARGIQLYPSCGQITVTGSGTTTLPEGVAIPGVYTDSTPGIKFDLYSTYTSYPIPGPSVWDGTTGGSAPASSSSSAASKPTTSAAAPTTIASATAAPTTVATPSTTISTSVRTQSTSKIAAPAPTSTSSAAPAPATSTSKAQPVQTQTTTRAAPAPTTTSGVRDANQCWNDYNKCIAASQPQPDWQGCSATRDTCLSGARYFRLARSGTVGRRLL